MKIIKLKEEEYHIVWKAINYFDDENSEVTEEQNQIIRRIRREFGRGGVYALALTDQEISVMLAALNYYQSGKHHIDQETYNIANEIVNEIDRKIC